MMFESLAYLFAIGLTAVQYTPQQRHMEYTKAVDSFAVSSIDAKFTTEMTKIHRQSLALQILFVEKSLESAEVRQQAHEALRQSGREVENELGALLAFFTGALVSESGQIDTSELLRLTSGPVFQIQRLRQDTRSPKGAELRSVNKSDHQLLQYGVKYESFGLFTDAWTCLEPLRRDKQVKRVVWRKEIVDADFLIPPLVKYPTPSANPPSDLSLLWETPNKVVSFGLHNTTLPDQALIEVQVLGRRLTADVYLLAAFHNEGAIPLWSCRCSINSNRPRGDQIPLDQQNQVSASGVAELVGAISALNTEGVLEADQILWIRDVTFNNDWTALDGVGTYPKSIRQYHIAPIRTDTDTPADKLAFGPARQSTLTITKIAIGENVAPVVPIDLSNGTSFLDRDKNEGYIIGDVFGLTQEPAFLPIEK